MKHSRRTIYEELLAPRKGNDNKVQKLDIKHTTVTDYNEKKNRNQQ